MILIQHKKTKRRLTIKWGYSPVLGTHNAVPYLFPSRAAAAKDLAVWLSWHKDYTRKDFEFKSVRIK